MIKSLPKSNTFSEDLFADTIFTAMIFPVRNSLTYAYNISNNELITMKLLYGIELTPGDKIIKIHIYSPDKDACIEYSSTSIYGGGHIKNKTWYTDKIPKRLQQESRINSKTWPTQYIPWKIAKDMLNEEKFSTIHFDHSIVQFYKDHNYYKMHHNLNDPLKIA